LGTIAGLFDSSGAAIDKNLPPEVRSELHANVLLDVSAAHIRVSTA
jgi:hypothetical protein